MNYKKSFTILEVSITIAIISIIYSGIIGTQTALLNSERMKTTKVNLDIVNDALQRYMRQNHSKLPCVSNLDDRYDNVDFGKAKDCSVDMEQNTGGHFFHKNNNSTVVIGSVPTYTLGIKDKYMFDGWGNKITYTVILDMTKDPLNYENTSENGGIVIHNAYGDALINDKSLNSIVPYILVSHGRDGKGAFNYYGKQTNDCLSQETRDSENCNNDNVFRDTKVVASSSAIKKSAGYFHDFVRWQVVNLSSSDIKDIKSINFYDDEFYYYHVKGIFQKAAGLFNITGVGMAGDYLVVDADESDFKNANEVRSLKDSLVKNSIINVSFVNNSAVYSFVGAVNIPGSIICDMNSLTMLQYAGDRRWKVINNDSSMLGYIHRIYHSVKTKDGDEDHVSPKIIESNSNILADMSFDTYTTGYAEVKNGDNTAWEYYKPSSNYDFGRYIETDNLIGPLVGNRTRVMASFLGNFYYFLSMGFYEE